MAANKKTAQDLLIEQNKKQIEQETLDNEQIIITAQALSDMKVSIEEQEAQRILELKRKVRDQERAEDLKTVKDSLTNAQNLAGSLQSLSDLGFSIKQANLKKGTKEEEAAARQQFKINKALALTGAIMNGAQSILAITSVPDFTLGIATAIRIGAQVLTTASAVAKIASTQFTATGGGGSNLGGGAASVSGAGASLAPPQPQSLAFNNNTVGAVGGIGGNQANVQKVVLVSHDVTRAQKNDKIIEMQATFG